MSNYQPGLMSTGSYGETMSDPYGQTSRSPAQLTRLENEWRRLQRNFAFHPHVTVTPLGGDPPVEYQIDYRVTTLVIDEAGQLQYGQGASVHFSLPAEFPDHPPTVTPLAGLFHPNISWEGFHLASAWQPNETLVNLVRRIGDLLAYRIFDPDSVVNTAAMDWLNANTDSLPLDAGADFAPAAGGEPLSKILRHGNQTIDAIRHSLEAFQVQLLSPAAPDAAAVQEYSLRTRLALDLFLQDDVPETFRSAASDLHESARELPSATGSYDYLRSRRARLEAVEGAIRGINVAAAALSTELKNLNALDQARRSRAASGEHNDDAFPARSALESLPEAASLQALQLRLPKQLGEADRRAAALRDELAALRSESAPSAIPSDTRLGRRLEAEFANVDGLARAKSDEAAGALDAAGPVLERGREDVAALEQVARYREYVDMVGRADALHKRLMDWGAEGIQACYIESGVEHFGPFQFEEVIDVGQARVVVRNLSQGALSIYDAANETLLGKSVDGKVTVQIGAEATSPQATDEPGAASEAAGSVNAAKMLFQLTDRCDDLLVQLDFLRRQTQEAIDKVNPAAEVSGSWCGEICRSLAAPATRKSIRSELARASQRWKLAMLDLGGLSPLKERLITWHLLTRCSERIPVLVASIKSSRRGLKESDKRLAEIVRRCGRDVETDRLVVPPKYAARYEQEMKFRDDSGKEIAGNATILKTLVIRLSRRLKDAKLLGRSEIPSLRILPPLPPHLESSSLGDADLGEQIAALETLLKTSLGGPRRDPNWQQKAIDPAADHGAPATLRAAQDPVPEPSSVKAMQSDEFELPVPTAAAEDDPETTLQESDQIVEGFEARDAGHTDFVSFDAEAEEQI